MRGRRGNGARAGAVGAPVALIELTGRGHGVAAG
jgi:hypothetical protein